MFLTFAFSKLSTLIDEYNMLILSVELIIFKFFIFFNSSSDISEIEQFISIESL